MDSKSHGKIPDGWRLVDNDETPSTLAKIWEKSPGEWQSRGPCLGERYYPGNSYIVPELSRGDTAVVLQHKRDGSREASHGFTVGDTVKVMGVCRNGIAKCLGKSGLTQELYVHQLKKVDPAPDRKVASQPLGECIGTTQDGELVYIKSPPTVFTTTIEKEEKVLSPEEKKDIAAIIAEQLRSQKNGRSGIASKSLSVAGGTAKSLAKWAFAPAKPIGWLAAKTLQYALFMGLVGSIGAGGYWAWKNSGSVIPTIKWEQKDDKSPSDKTVSSEDKDNAVKLTSFIATGDING